MLVTSIEQMESGGYRLDNVHGRAVNIFSAAQGDLKLEERVKDYDQIADACDISQIQFLVEFGGLFEPLIGKTTPKQQFLRKDSTPDSDKLRERNYRILELENPEAKEIVDRVTLLANKIIEVGLDPELCAEYARVASDGFTLMREVAPVIGQTKTGELDERTRLISLERGALPVARMVLGRDKDAVINGERRVVTKRIHLLDQPDTHLANLVQWRHPRAAVDMVGKHVIIPDFVNPASYASSLAALITQRILAEQFDKESRPIASLSHRSFAVTWQGLIEASRNIQTVTGIQRPEFIALGLGFELDSRYYLTGARVVADAGYVLETAGLMPSWYTRK